MSNVEKIIGQIGLRKESNTSGSDSGNRGRYEQNYLEIVSAYDVAEDLVSTLEFDDKSHLEERLALVENIVESVEDSLDSLSEEYAHMAEGESGRSKINRTRVEASLRSMFQMFDDYSAIIGGMPATVAAFVSAQIDPIMEKLRDITENVVLYFMELIDISLDRIINKAKIEEMRKRNQKLALQMHALQMARLQAQS